MGTYRVRVALDEMFEPGDLDLDLRTNPLHPLHEYAIRIAATPTGGVWLTVSLPAPDLWAAILSTMVLMRHVGYMPTAIDAAEVEAAPHTLWRS